MLDFSKIEAGKLDLEERPFDPRDVVDSTGAMLAPLAQAKGVELTLFIADSVPGTLRGDEHRLRQVLTNLLANAIKFTDSGEVSVRAEANRAGEASARLRVQVRDTGIGIEREHLAQLFEPFTQADTSTTRRFGGTGLGLAISRRLVSIMGGDLSAASEPGRGSTFRFEVPLEVVDAERSSRRTRVVLPEDTRVLVVDDNATNREILNAYLRGRVAVCDDAEGGEAAVEMLDAAARAGVPYDLALLDSEMPGMSGAEVAAAVRATPLLQATRLVMLTSAGTSGGVPDVARSLAKPVRRAVLLETLAEVLGDVAPAEAAAAAAHAIRTRGVVLVAEDNPVNQVVIETMLRQRGLEVDVANDGLEALARLDPERHVAVFMDCQMPNLDGYETTARIRAEEPEDRHVPIVAMTAHAFEGRPRALPARRDGRLPLEAAAGRRSRPGARALDRGQGARRRRAGRRRARDQHALAGLRLRREAPGRVRPHDAADARGAAGGRRGGRRRRAPPARAQAAGERRHGRRAAPVRARARARERQRRGRRRGGRRAARPSTAGRSTSSAGSSTTAAYDQPLR